MTPIQDLLHRIRWDMDFGRGEFSLAYYDRIDHELIHVPLREIVFDKDSPGVFELVNHEGLVHTIPLHRVRAVYRDGILIWQRSQPP